MELSNATKTESHHMAVARRAEDHIFLSKHYWVCSNTQLSHRGPGQCVWTISQYALSSMFIGEKNLLHNIVRFRSTESWKTSTKTLHFIFGHPFLAGPNASQGSSQGMEIRLYHLGRKCKIQSFDSPQQQTLCFFFYFSDT